MIFFYRKLSALLLELDSKNQDQCFVSKAREDNKITSILKYYVSSFIDFPPELFPGVHCDYFGLSCYSGFLNDKPLICQGCYIGYGAVGLVRNENIPS